SQPGMDEETPPGQMIVRFSTVIVEDQALAQDARRGHGGSHREQEGPVRRRKHLDDVCLPETSQARDIQSLVEGGTSVRKSTNPAEPPRKRGIYSEEVDGPTLFSEVREKGLRLDPLTAEYLHARRHERDAGAHRLFALPRAWTYKASVRATMRSMPSMDCAYALACWPSRAASARSSMRR